MIKYFVRTTGQRTLDASYSQVEYELLVDGEHNARKSFVEQLEYLTTLDCDVVILEDDLILCKDFKKHIEEAINENKNIIINFFYAPDIYFTSHIAEYFTWNQCIYYPKDVLKVLAKEMRHQYTLYPNTAHDKVEGRALKMLSFPNLIYRPCLVQHIDNGSLVGNGFGPKRRTPYFLDYLNELDIEYKDAYNKDNKDKLIKLMNEKFNN